MLPSLTYLKRLVEEALVTALAAFGTTLTLDDDAFGKAAVLAAVAAAGRAAYGLVVRHLGDDLDRPSVQ
jgi:hypothetical protein